MSGADVIDRPSAPRLTAPADAPHIASHLLSLLPAIYREDPFLGQYLWAFEQVLLDLEHRIDLIHELFDPNTTRASFLPWLSSWVAFMVRADLDEVRQRAFLSRVVSLYRLRGTRKNLKDLLEIFTHGQCEVIDDPAAPTPADDPNPVHYFYVKVRLPQAKTREQLHQSAIARALIELEKPAHTHYRLDIIFPAMQIGVTSTIGVDTLIGTRENR